MRNAADLLTCGGAGRGTKVKTIAARRLPRLVAVDETYLTQK